MAWTSGAPTVPLHCARVAHRSGLERSNQPVWPYGSGSACMPCEMPRTALRLQRERARTRGRLYPPNMTETPDRTSDRHRTPARPANEAPEDPDGVIADAAIDPDDAAISHPLVADAKVEAGGSHLRRARRRPAHRAGAGRGRHRAHLRHPGAHAADRAGRRRPDRPGPHRHGQDARVRRPAAAAAGAGRGRARRRPTASCRPAAPPARWSMVPTRELCVQVARDLHQRRQATSACRSRRSTAAAPTSRRSPPCATGVDIVVGTPGRLLDLANSGHLVLGAGQRAGARRGRRDARPRLPARRRARAAACCPSSARPCCSRPRCPARSSPWPAVHEPADTHPRRDGRRRATSTSAPASSSTARTRWTRSRCWPGCCRPADRGLTMIFTRTKRTAAKVADDLAERGFAAAAVHGDLGQGAREQALRAFRSGKVDVLVATDVAARGIDVDDVTHVINYQCPEDEKTYVHRIGRTGRAGKTGIGGHLRRLGRHAPLEDDQRGARPRHRRAAGDLLHLAAPVRRPRHPRGRHRPAAARAAHPRRASTPRRSRTSARPAASAVVPPRPPAGRVPAGAAGTPTPTVARAPPAAAGPGRPAPGPAVADDRRHRSCRGPRRAGRRARHTRHGRGAARTAMRLRPVVGGPVVAPGVARAQRRRPRPTRPRDGAT